MNAWRFDLIYLAFHLSACNSLRCFPASLGYACPPHSFCRFPPFGRWGCFGAAAGRHRASRAARCTPEPRSVPGTECRGTGVPFELRKRAEAPAINQRSPLRHFPSSASFSSSLPGAWLPLPVSLSPLHPEGFHFRAPTPLQGTWLCGARLAAGAACGMLFCAPLCAPPHCGADHGSPSHLGPCCRLPVPPQ